MPRWRVSFVTEIAEDFEVEAADEEGAFEAAIQAKRHAAVSLARNLGLVGIETEEIEP